MKKFLMLLSLIAALNPLSGLAEWNADWGSQKKIKVETTGVSAINDYAVIVRLHSGNFDFLGANIDGSDLRFIAADDKTELKYHIEKYDATNELAVIWVKLPKIDQADKDAHFWLYSGNEKATATSDAKQTWDANTVAVFNFAEKTLFQDNSATGLIASGEITLQKAALLGEAAVFTAKPFVIPANPAVKRLAGAGYTWSAWVKPQSLPQQAGLYNQADAVVLKIEDLKLTLSVGGTNVSGGEIKPATWQHVAFTLDGGKASIYINGVSVATGDVPPIDAESDIKIGDGYVGEMDEVEIANVARSAEWLKLSASSQGMDSQLLKIEASEDEDGEEEGEANYIGILIGSLTLDAEIVIGILAVMFISSIWVMWDQAMVVLKTDNDNKKFLTRFQKASGGDLLGLDKGANYPRSSLYKLYLAGLREIRKRQVEGETLALSGSSMDAIKAAIDADLVRETQRLNSGMVLLTIAISGGPFLGLLGTVVGVMITFAAIAAAGDVNVNAIAPGIAAALLATVAGLAVAIPALFGYNYLASRIKNITISMQIFVDEFVTRSAELYGK
ncbi:MAG: MotA/TolQ/ExbB proton channel family protein [Methylotenera sp.]|nr:MotA/TolQ/ExbB proton channel family protein [Methylotenera sp.]